MAAAGSSASSRSSRDGRVTVRAGTSAHGQGHATSFSMIVADKLGVPMESIAFEQSDTAIVPRGQGTGGSRSLQLGGSAVDGAADLVLARARDIAASLLEVSADDLEVSDGSFQVAGVPGATVSWADVAAAAEDAGEPLRAEHDFAAQGATFPFGAHVAVVEVDTETGLVTPRHHFAVDDCGRILNPLLVAGQQMGGVAQGVAQALWEEFVYDAEGQPITSTFVDYAMPAATEMPPMTLVEHRHRDAAEPARRQGHRRVRHGRLDARGPERRRRRAEPPRRAAPRHAAQAGPGRRGACARPRRARCPTRGASRPRRSTSCPSRARATSRTRSRTSDRTPLRIHYSVLLCTGSQHH